MRYYTIVVTDPATGVVFRQYSSLANAISSAQSGVAIPGMTLPGALTVEFDIPVTDFAVPMGAAWVRIWGISLEDIAQSADFNGKTLTMYAGMAAGLPLANPGQAGVILSGTIQQGFGNWQDTSMTLDFIVQAQTGALDAPKNIVLDWVAGMPLSTAIENTLSVAFPKYKRNINISPNLVLPADEPSYHYTLVEFAQHIKQVSQKIIGGQYSGVNIVLTQDTFNVYDGTTPTDAKAIQFTDLIGQPTWIGALTIQINCVLRADIQMGDFVTLPQAQVSTTPQSMSQYRNSLVFQGKFQVVLIRHVGNSRIPSGSAWITTINLVPTVAA